MKKPSAKSPEKQSCRDSRIDIEIRELKKELEMYKLIFNNVHHGCELTDNKGYITHFNEIYKRFLRLEPKTRKIKPSFLV